MLGTTPATISPKVSGPAVVGSPVFLGLQLLRQLLGQRVHADACRPDTGPKGHLPHLILGLIQYDHPVLLHSLDLHTQHGCASIVQETQSVLLYVSIAHIPVPNVTSGQAFVRSSPSTKLG